VFWIVVLASKKIPPDAPTIRFHTKIYHPNIDHKTGKLCADYQQKWYLPELSSSMRGRISGNTNLWSQRTSPDQWTLLSLLVAICALLASPNARDPLIPEIAQKYVEDPKGYYEAAQMWTKRYASSSEKPEVAALFPGEPTDPQVWESIPAPLSLRDGGDKGLKDSKETWPYLRWKYDDRFISNGVNCVVLELSTLPMESHLRREAKKETGEPQSESQNMRARANNTAKPPDLRKVVEQFFFRDARQNHCR
jgi:ubiquitin-protein ligase